jgi:hypothetical protein
MKFVSLHETEFDRPGFAFFVGFMQFMTTAGIEILCSFFMSSLNMIILCFVKYLAFGQILKLDLNYSKALPPENKITNLDNKPYLFTLTYDNRHRREVPTQEALVNSRSGEKAEPANSCLMKVCRLFYKCLRVFYCSYIFYFMPFTAIYLPYVMTINGSDS